MADFNLTEADNGKTIDAHKGDKITISLESKPSTGFLWQSSDSTAGALLQAQHDPALSNRPGAPAMVRFKFEVDKTGNIVLNFARPWDELTPPEKWFVINVNIAS